MSYSKSAILAKVDDFTIIKHYVPEFNESVLTGNRNIISIFNQSDSNPSLSFYKGNRGINYKCHSTGFQGDCFQLVADLKGLDNRTQFDMVLESIVDDMRLNIDLHKPYISKDWKAEYYEKFTKKAYGYWETFKVDQKTLAYYKVRQLQTLTYKEKSKFRYKDDNVMAFEFDISGRKKLYIPKQKGIENKYVMKTQTSSDIFGAKQLKPYKVPYILICEGEKDCLVAASHGISAVSFQSANTLPTRTMIRELYKHASYIIVCYDNDEPGQKGAEKISKYFDLINYRIHGDYNDIAEYLPKANKDDFKNLLWQSIQDWRKENNLRIWEENNCYMRYAQKRNGEEEKRKICISNFTLEVDAMVMTEDRPQRLMRLVGSDHSTSTLSISNSVFSSEQKFSDFASDQKGNFYFHGTKGDLQEITKRVFHLSDYLDKASKLGYDKKRDLFILANGVFKKGKFLRPNDIGIFEDIIIPTAVKNYNPSSGDNFHIRHESESKISTKDYLNFMCKAWKDHIGITCFAYILASTNFDWLSQTKGTNFPMLNIDGQARTGKGSLIKMMLSIYSTTYRETSLHNATANYLTRKLEQTPNIPVWFDEYLNSLRDHIIQIIKNFYDLIGKGKASYTAGSETTSSRIESPVIITGEEAPVSNEALYSRMIVLSLPPLAKTAESISYFNNAELEVSKGISHILGDLLSCREEIKNGFTDGYLELLKYFQDSLTGMKLSIDTRIIKNYCKVFTPLLIISKSDSLGLGLSVDNIKAVACQVMADHTISQRKVDDVNVFLENFLSMNSLPFSNQNNIREDYDYIYDDDMKCLYIRSLVLDKSANYHFHLYQRHGKDSKAIMKYLSYKEYFKGHKKKYFRTSADEKRQLRCMELFIPEMPEFIQDFFMNKE